jgi:Ser/Thr protein kinase RdoA (MazF antagonist)
MSLPPEDNSIMSAIPMDCVRQVLGQFGVEPESVTHLGSHGGFSGADLWRVKAPGGEWCLKAWPVNFEVEQLRHAHWLMRQGRSAGLDYVPAPRDSADGSGCVRTTGHIWDLATWQPGRADFHIRPSETRLVSACRALAELHRAWKPAKPSPGFLPAIRRRMAAAEQWHGLTRSGWQPGFSACGDDSIAVWAERAWVVLGFAARRVHTWLEGWTAVRLPLQPCLCDLWHDHVLFTNDDVTGVVDYGSVKTDHVAVDLARLLGSFVEDDPDLRDAGLDVYDREAGLGGEERALVDVLDRTGAIISLMNWLRWIYLDKRVFADEDRVGARIAGLVRRVESW